MEYPERTKRVKMLRFLLDEQRKAYSYREDDLGLIYYWERGRRWTDVKISGWYLHLQGMGPISIPAQLGLSVAECVSLLRQLSSEDYIYFHERGTKNWSRVPGPRASRVKYGQAPYAISHLTDKGLREIGELPDPQAQLIQGFEAAIEAIKHDNRLTAREKRQKINWLQEGTIIARTLSIDAIKAILVGTIL